MQKKIRTKILLGMVTAMCLTANLNGFAKVRASNLTEDDGMLCDEVSTPGVYHPRSEDAAALNVRALFSSIRDDRLSKVQEMLKPGIVDVDSLLNDEGFTPLQYAAMLGCYDIVRYIVGACHADIQNTGLRRKTPLKLAEENGQILVANFLRGRTHNNGLHWPASNFSRWPKTVKVAKRT